MGVPYFWLEACSRAACIRFRIFVEYFTGFVRTTNNICFLSDSCMSVQYQISIHISLFAISVINITTKTNLERKGFIWLHILITVHHKGRSERRNRNHRGKLLISLLPCHKEPYLPGTVSPTKFPSHKLW